MERSEPTGFVAMQLMGRLLVLLPVLLSCFAAILAVPARAVTKARPLASLQSFTGIWDMPTARILPDWSVRFKYGKAEPYRYYGVALGVFDRLEFHGQFTETSSVIAFPGYGYGYHKDRNAGARLVLLQESSLWPQVAVGAYDPIGTSLFPSRYLVASKMFGNLDLTLGLGQGLLGGESLDNIARQRQGETFDTTFLLSSPFRQTSLFGGIEYHYSPDLTLSAEYSSLKYEDMFGSPQAARWPVNLGLKYRLGNHVYLQGGFMRGQEWSLGLSGDFPLDPEGLLPWKKEAPYLATEKKRWQAYEADNRQLAALLAREVRNDGFTGVETAVRDHAIWIEFNNSKYLSHAKALGRVARVVDGIAPERITTVYLNLVYLGQVRQCLRASRQELRAFLDGRLDKEAFLTFADLSLYNRRQQQAFFTGEEEIGSYRVPDSLFDYSVDLKVRTFLNNKEGFFKNKIFLRPRASVNPWKNGTFYGELEFTLLNEFDEVLFAPLEPEPTRTDVVLYERESRPRISVLAFDQHASLPFNVLGRFSVGLFESEYAGFGAEVFRLFDDGRFGLGFESEAVWKRDPENNFKLSDTITKTYDSHFLNLYGLLWPDQGIEAGLKIGKFLAGDMGFRLELRRSFKYFTIGAWLTKTDTSDFINPDNRDASEKGVFIRIPFSIFSDRDRRGNIYYTFSTFTRDPGQTVRQPSRLYPMDPYQSVEYTRETLEDMRKN
ncbi:YjbH domain-containing protein [Desulfolithobacter dissulfuricans]|nr:YjbH domain-containing protein [Desulfolithobacter dissulfuricans]